MTDWTGWRHHLAAACDGMAAICGVMAIRFSLGPSTLCATPPVFAEHYFDGQRRGAVSTGIICKNSRAASAQIRATPTAFARQTAPFYNAEAPASERSRWQAQSV